jgi:copper(I)-binding protein
VSQPRGAVAPWLVIGVALVVGGCGNGDEPASALLVDGGVAVVDAWVRPSPPTADEAAFYISLELRGGADTALLAAASDRCLVVQPHATAIDDAGVASMGRALDDQLRITDDHPLEMEPNGTHLMCLGLTGALSEGEEIVVTIDLDGHDPIDVPVRVEQRF